MEASHDVILVTCTGARQPTFGFTGVEPVSAACGRTFPIDVSEGDPGLTHTWDVVTDGNGNVLSRHKQVTCPHCGTRTWVTEEQVKQ